MRLIGGSVPPDDESLETNAEARASTVRLMAGMVRHIYENLTGRRASTSEPWSIPKNPQGEYGIDLSGPPYGPALRHILWSMGGRSTTSDVVGEKNWTVNSGSGPRTWTARFWVRPHVSYNSAPYSRGFLIWRGNCASGTNKDIDISVRRLGRGSGVRTQPYTVASTSSESFDFGAAWVDLVPGHNKIAVTAECSDSAGVTVQSMALVQLAKIRHTF